MKVTFDIFPDTPKLTLTFDNFEDLCHFFVGFLEAIGDE